MKLIASIILLIIPSIPGVQAQTPEIAFTHVNVVPMDKERILPRQTVLIKDGKIVAIGPVERIRIPRQTRRIDGHERYLMPGLADMHVHLANRGDPWSDSSLLLYVANGVTTVRNMWGRSPDVLALRRDIEEGKVIGPRIFTTGPLTDGIRPSALAPA